MSPLLLLLRTPRTSLVEREMGVCGGVDGDDLYGGRGAAVIANGIAFGGGRGNEGIAGTDAEDCSADIDKIPCDTTGRREAIGAERLLDKSAAANGVSDVRASVSVAGGTAVSRWLCWRLSIEVFCLRTYTDSEVAQGSVARPKYQLSSFGVAAAFGCSDDCGNGCCRCLWLSG